MTPAEESSNRSAVEPTETLAWLDGLAGRVSEGSPEALAEGQRLRDALLGDLGGERGGSWEQIEQKAFRTAEVAPAMPPERPAAANAPAFGARWGWAAVAAACLLVAVSLPFGPGGDPGATSRGGQTGQGGEAVWLVEEPEAAAAGLASELRALGAEVELVRVDSGTRMTIVAGAAAVEALNGRLQAFQTALDASGRLVLHVRRMPAADKK